VSVIFILHELNDFCPEQTGRACIWTVFGVAALLQKQQPHHAADDLSDSYVILVMANIYPSYPPLCLAVPRKGSLVLRLYPRKALIFQRNQIGCNKAT
jgi:hypothetical protein